MRGPGARAGGRAASEGFSCSDTALFELPHPIRLPRQRKSRRRRALSNGPYLGRISAVSRPTGGEWPVGGRHGCEGGGWVDVRFVFVRAAMAENVSTGNSKKKPKALYSKSCRSRRHWTSARSTAPQPVALSLARGRSVRLFEKRPPVGCVSCPLCCSETRHAETSIKSTIKSQFAPAIPEFGGLGSSPLVHP